MRGSLLAAVIAGGLLAGCAGAAETAGAPVAAPSPVQAPPSLAPIQAPPSSTMPPATRPPPVIEVMCPPWDDGTVAPEAAALSEVLATHLLDPRLAGNQVGVSVWVDGLGEVFAHQGDERLLIASNQKLLTAMGVLDAFALDATLRTLVVASPGSDLAPGMVAGDLILVGGGDPTLTSDGPHSLAALAAAVRFAGISEVRGGLVVDESRYELARSAPGWQDWHIPTYTGPLSALVVDDNRGRTDPAFLAEPALGHGESFRDRLAAAGVSVAGPVTVGVAPTGAVTLAGLDSAPIGDLLSRMLLASDNEVAESLTREAGVVLAGDGSTLAGTTALESRLLDGCAPIAAGSWGDGSGMSRGDLRSAREMRRLVQHAKAQAWWPELVARLPVAGRTGTLAGRFGGTAAEGRVVAKTGTIIGGSSLTGIVTTVSGREAVFSVIVNGDGAPAAIKALDDFIVTLASA